MHRTPLGDDMQDRLRAGDALVGTWVTLSDPAVAELLAPDFDLVFLDTEHTPLSLETVADHARAVAAADGDALSLVRVPWNDPPTIKRVLDLGVGGVMVPMVDTAADAEAAVSACRYPPAGVRGVASSRASDYGRDLGGYVERANDEVRTVVQIETRPAVDNVEEIAAVEGVDALFLGPADLTSDLGVFGEWSDERFRDAVSTVLDAAEAADTPVGTIGGSPEDVDTFASMGFDFVVAGLDMTYLLGGAGRARRAAEEAMD